jgi:hypothetical protein
MRSDIQRVGICRDADFGPGPRFDAVHRKRAVLAASLSVLVDGGFLIAGLLSPSREKLKVVQSGGKLGSKGRMRTIFDTLTGILIELALRDMT